MLMKDLVREYWEKNVFLVKITLTAILENPVDIVYIRELVLTCKVL